MKQVYLGSGDRTSKLVEQNLFFQRLKKKAIAVSLN